jgi:endonuclease-3
MAVDTHVFRVANRLPLVHGRTPEEVEEKLTKRIPPQYALHAHHWLILHGRYTCKARAPECHRCVVRDLCRSPEKRG